MTMTKEEMAELARSDSRYRLLHRAFFVNSGLPTFDIKPAWHEEGFLVGFEVWDGDDLLGQFPFDDKCRAVLRDVGIIRPQRR
jgi:hypothetical protein